MNRIKINILILSILMFNCAKTSYYTKEVDSKIRLTPFTEEEGYVLKKRFEASSTRHNFFWGLVIAKADDLETILRKENVYDGNLKDQAIGNLVITEQYTFFNSLLDLIFIGIYRPYSVEIEGSLYSKKDNPSENLETIEKRKGKK